MRVESKNYEVFNEYEQVFLRIKNTSKVIKIGDFYGDPYIILISEDEMYCVMGGAGIIVYRLAEPFEEYQYNTLSNQWKDWGRESSERTIWIDNVVFIDAKHIKIETEDLQRHIINLDNFVPRVLSG